MEGLKELAKETEKLHSSLLYGKLADTIDECGKLNPISELHIVKAINLIQQAEYEFKLAHFHHVRELGNLRLGK